MIRFVSAVLAAAACLHVAGCSGELPEDEFRHNSPRPSCEYTVGPGREAYYPEPVLVATEEWDEPVLVAPPLTDDCPNDAVEISRDGQTIYFFWSPTVGGTNEELLHIHTGTYRAERTGTDPGAFSGPRYFDLQKGTAGSVDAKPSFTPDGSFVYFHSTRAANTGFQADPWVDDYLDIYRAPVIRGEPGIAANLGPPVNTVYLDGEHTLSPDGNRLYLTSTRPGGLGGPDIWVSERSGAGWTDPENLGAPVNSADSDGQPGFAADDPDTMYFVSNRDGRSSIYRSTWESDLSSWSAPEMILTGYVGEPALVADGSVMYFVHVLIDDEDVFGSNIWYVTRR